MTRLLSATVMSAKTTRTRRLSSQRNPWLKDGEAAGPIKRSSSTGCIRSLLPRACGDQPCISLMDHMKRDFEESPPSWFCFLSNTAPFKSSCLYIQSLGDRHPHGSGEHIDACSKGLRLLHVM